MMVDVMAPEHVADAGQHDADAKNIEILSMAWLLIAPSPENSPGLPTPICLPTRSARSSKARGCDLCGSARRWLTRLFGKPELSISFNSRSPAWFDWREQVTTGTCDELPPTVLDLGVRHCGRSTVRAWRLVRA